jgi:hypothetical protein
MGIGALPERSLSNMADGGIVGYADGGDIQRFQVGGMPERLQDMKKRPDESGEDFARRVALARQALYQSQMFPTDEQKAAARRQALENERAKNMAEVAKVDSMNLPPRKLGPYSQTGGIPDALPQTASPAARPAAAPPPPSAALPAAPTPAAAPSVNAAAGLQALATSNLTAQDIVNARKDIAFAQDPVVDTLKAERQALVDESNKNAKEELISFKQRMAKQGDPYAKQEERANKQEASIAESAERSPYLALMEAGFAMMAGDSPYAMKNIGAGALAGTKTYREGLAQLEKAKEKLSETRDRIDGLRLIRSDLNDKEERDINRGINKTALEGKTLMFSALEKLTDRSQARIEADTNAFLAAETARRLADRQYNTEVMRQREESARAVLRDTGDTARNTATNVAAGIRNSASIAATKDIAANANKPQILYQKAIDTAVAEAVSSMAYQIAKTPAEKAQLEDAARARARTNFLTVYPELAGTMKGVGSPLDLTKWGSPVKN